MREMPGFPVALIPMRPGPLVAVVGDSLLYGATDALRSAMSATGVGQVRLAAVPGSRIPDLMPQIATGAGADVLVVALGSNDLRRLAGDGRQDEGIVFDALLHAQQAVATASNAPCLVWVNVGVGNDALGMTQRVTSFNVSVAALLTRSGRPTRLVDWQAISAGDPALFDWDGLHLTAAGQAAFARAVTDGVLSCGVG